MRLFVAIDLPSVIVKTITNLQNELRPFTQSLRWVNPNSAHLTLKFSGYVQPQNISAIDKQLQSIQAKPFKVQVSSVGFFPNNQTPRVLWLDVNSSECQELYRKVEASMTRLGFPAEKRGFIPHLTLARRRKDHRVNLSFVKTVMSLKEFDVNHFPAERFFLFRSLLTQGGTSYEKLFEYRLNNTIPELS